ncbi:MAG: DM13 domain-containing protein, partial [Chloroflexota bacterium]|nr:DM13 domain-containing protein [Chloroflexota bacterium]
AVALSLLATTAYRRGWHRTIWRYKLRTALVTIPLLIVTIPLSYYLLSPLWTRTTVVEESPLAVAASNNSIPGVPAVTRTPTMQSPSATSAGASANANTTATATATATVAPAKPTATTAPLPTTAPEPTTTSATLPIEEPTQEPTIELPVEPASEPTIEPPLATVPEPTPEPTPEPVPEPTPEPAPAVFTPRIVSSGLLSGADDFHFAEGTALLIETEPGVYVLRLEEFSVRNGPDLFVYLAAGPNQIDDSAINLGDLRATDGSINYDIPAGIDISQYQGVVIWCRAFAVFFGSAPLYAS